MEITITKATLEDQNTVQNLARFYVYDMSRYCGISKGWETPPNGLFDCVDLSRYWQEPNRYPFLIKVDNELAGFVLINKIGSTPEVDWNIGEFFIIAKYQRKGVGSHVLGQIVKQFSGLWEVMQIPENQGAVAFWEKIISRSTKNKFEKNHKMIAEPTLHPMIVLRFHSKDFQDSSFDDSYEVCYQETVSSEVEAVLVEGITEEAQKNKGVSPIKTYAFFIRNSSRDILGGIKGATYYGCLYVDSLWITPALRNKGWGSKLIKDSEKLGRDRNCTFVSLTTMDWEALPFYEHLGYKIEYTREGFEKNSKMFVLRKEL